jgi:predicted TIM-barrel fold metal-dependent hydrolase
MREYRVIDADTHVYYPKDMWERWLPAQFRERAPRVVEHAQGGDAWLMDPAKPPEPLGLTVSLGKGYEGMKWFGYRYEDIRPGCYDPRARLADMDYDGVDAQVIFSDNRTMGQVMASPDREFHFACVRAYNDWLADEFCAADPERLVGLAQLPNLGVEAAVEELKRSKRKGMRGVILRNWPSGNPGLSAADDPFWAAAQEAAMPIAIHLGFAAGASIVAAAPKGKVLAAAGTASMVGIAPILLETIFEGLFDRFPGLRMASVETGAGWLPYLLEQMDDKYWRNRHWAELDLELLPSEYWFRNWVITFVLDKYGVANRHAIGVANMMWSTDYPHNSCDWPYSRKILRETFADVPREERRLMTCDNCAGFYSLAK